MYIGVAQKSKIFIDHYAELSTALPFKDMASHFVSARIISTDDNHVIQHTAERSKIACLVLNKIYDSLKCGDEEKFDGFLFVMENNDDMCSLHMAEKIRLKLFPDTGEHESKCYLCIVNSYKLDTCNN